MASDPTTYEEEASAPAASRSNVDGVYEILRQTILSGELKPGSRLSQVRLAAKYDMSRGPLREALRLLERDRLVVTEHQRMVRVAPVSLDDLDELYALRIINESYSVGRSAALLNADQLGRAASSLAAMDTATDAEDWAGWRAEHRTFHMTLYEPAGERTSQLLSDLFDHADRYRRTYHEGQREAPVVAAVEHKAIFAACEARDSDEAQLLMARHLGRTALTLFATAAPEHDPMRVRDAMRFTARSPVASSRRAG